MIATFIMEKHYDLDFVWHSMTSAIKNIIIHCI